MNLVSKILYLLKNPKTLADKINLMRINYLITKHSQKTKNFFFIQIGSGDGITGDPIHKFIIRFKWDGILVEPVRYLFDKLTNNYAGYKQNLIFENLAINKEAGLKDFYRMEESDEPNNPDWYDQLGSFNKEVVIRHKNMIPNFDKHFISEKVKSITFPMLLNKHQVKKIDLLDIDTEGYDFEIIKMIPFKKIKPKMILYEYMHLNKEDQSNCAALLKKHGYKLITAWGDCFAYLLRKREK